MLMQFFNSGGLQSVPTRAMCIGPGRVVRPKQQETEMLVNIGKGIELNVDTTKLGLPPEEMLSAVARHIIYLGLRNPLMDSHAGITSDETDFVEKSRATAEKKLTAMYAGEVRVAGTREGDPVRAEAKRLAVKAVEAAIKKAGKKVGDYDRKAITEKAVSVIDKYMDTARRNVEAAKALDVDVDVSGL